MAAYSSADYSLSLYLSVRLVTLKLQGFPHFTAEEMEALWLNEWQRSPTAPKWEI